MILFKEDWKNYPSAVIHYQTSNQTFLRLAELYKNMGIENHYFMLALYNPALSNVNPFCPFLTQDQKNAVAIECRWNPWYVYREIARIDIQGSEEPCQMLANRGNIAFLWLTLCHITTYLIAPRQHGKSTGSDVQMNNVEHIAGRKTKIALLTKDDQLRTQNVDRLKIMRDYLPDYLNPYNKLTDGDNKSQVICERYKNEIITAVPRMSPAQAINVGRGLAAAVAVIDEPQNIPNIDIILKAMLPATTRARANAAVNDGFYYTAFTGTAGDRSTKSGKYMYRICRGGMVFSEKLFDSKNIEHVTKIVRTGSPGSMAIVNATFSYRQLGFSDAYMRSALELSMAEGITADMDFFNVWASGSGENPLSKTLLAAMRKGIREPKYTQIDEEHSYIIRWQVSEAEVKNGLRGRRVVCGCDSSEAVGKDAITLVFMDADTGELIGAADVNEANLYLYGQYLARVIGGLDHVVIVPERKSSGMGLIDALIVELPKYGKDPFRVIYSICVEDKLYEKTDHYKPILYNDYRRTQAFYDGCKKMFGFTTSGSGRHSRDILYNRVLLMGGKICHGNIKDETLVNEIGGLSIKGGRLDHSEGKHDDMVIAWLLSIWFLTQTQNLEWYGLENALSKNIDFEQTLSTTEKSAYDIYLEGRQIEYRKLITKLLDDLEMCSDNLIADRIELKIRSLQNKLKEETNTVLTLDTMISEAKSKREETAHGSAKLDRERWRQRQSERDSVQKKYF